MDITPFFAEYGLLPVFGVVLVVRLGVPLPALRLRERGIRGVRPLPGDIDAWVSAGFRIECV